MLMTRSSARRRPLLVAVLALLLAWSVPTTATADFAPVSLPEGGAAKAVAIAVSGPEWALVTKAGDVSKVWLTHDHGGTWSLIVESSDVPGVVAGPDGAFWLTTLRQAVATGSTPLPASATLSRIDPATGALSTVAALPLDLPPGAAASVAPPAFDAAGRPWVAWSDMAASPVVTLARLDGGTVAERFSAPLGQPPLDLELRSDAEGLTVSAPFGQSLRLTNGTLTPIPPVRPINEWSPLSSDPMPINGAPDLVVSSGRVMRRYSDAVYVATTWTAPENTTIAAVEGGFLATAFWLPQAHLGITFGDDPPLWFAAGQPERPQTDPGLSAVAQAWLARADHFRAQAGLPPLVGSRVISAAAESHSRYWTLNPEATGLALHAETPNRPGFTGVSPSDRCHAAGASVSCGEIMYPHNPTPIDGWVATPFHRGLLLNPTAGPVGGGKVGDGPAVMDNSSETGGLLVAPVMFPFGRYDGPLSFSGEAPDPATECRAAGQHLTAPFGTAVTVWVPDGSVTEMALRRDRGRPLAGCKLDATFIPDASLAPNARYAATATWTREDGTVVPLSWTFETTSGKSPTPPGTPLRCHPELRWHRLAASRGLALVISFDTCARAAVLVRLRDHRGRTVARTSSFRAARGGGRIVLRVPRLRPGRYRLTAKITGGMGATLSARVAVRR